MSKRSWLKRLVVALSLATLGGTSLAAGPARPGQGLSARIREQRDLHGDNGGRAFELAKAKISEGRALRARGEALRERAQHGNSIAMGREAQRLIAAGESVEREGRSILRRIRA